MSFSPDGKLLASASDDGTVKLWNPITGVSRCTLKGESRRTHGGRENSVKTVAFSPDGQLIASASFNLIEIWNPITGQSRGTLEGGSNTVSFSPNGQLLASVSDLVTSFGNQSQKSREVHLGVICAVLLQ